MDKTLEYLKAVEKQTKAMIEFHKLKLREIQDMIIEVLDNQMDSKHEKNH